VDLGLGLARRIPAGREGLIGCTSAGVLIARPARTRPTLRPPPVDLGAAADRERAARYRQWLLEHSYFEDDLIPFAIA
jgi:hypothetical protein